METPVSSGPETQTDAFPSVIPLRSPGTRAVNLPVPTTSLFGREREVAAVRDLLLTGPRRLVTLTGPGGVGKTRLALRVAAGLADHFDDGVVFVPLAAERDAVALPMAILKALGSVPSPQVAADASAFDRLIATLQNRQILLVLDNLEQLVEEITILSSLLNACTGLRILATSRIRLRLSDEQEFAVGPLPIPPATASGDDVLSTPAVALFVERAGAVHARFTPSETNALAIADICRRLDGLPLAIELASARLAHLSPVALRQVLADSPRGSALPLLTGGVRDAPARHRTMRDAIAWSVDLLDPPTRITFTRLGVFAGGFTLDAAEFIARLAPDSRLPTPDSILDAIGALIDASLVQLQPPTSSEGGSRYLMLETIREYALELLEQSGEADVVRKRLADWLIDLNLQVNEKIRGPEETLWLARLDAEQLNIRSILTWCFDRGDAETAIRLTTKGIWFLWSVRGTRRDESRWLVRALEIADQHPGTVDPATLGHGLHSLGMHVHRIGEFQRARDLIETGIRYLHEADDQPAVGIALGNLGNVLHDLGEFDDARATLREAIEVQRPLGDAKRLIIPLINLCAIAVSAGELGAAKSAIDEADEIVQREGNDRDVAYVNFFQGAIAVHQGEAAKAEPHLSKALTLFRELPDAQGIAMTPKYLALVQLDAGRPHAAARILGEALPVLLRMDLRPNASISLDTLAEIAIHAGRPAEGARFLGVSAGIRASLNADEGRPVDQDKLAALTNAARAALGPGQFTAAETAGRRLSFETAMTEAIALAASIAADEPSVEADAPPPSLLATLTDRERDILGLLIEGLSDREIADRRSLSHRTVSNHVGRILAKLDASSRTAAVAIALREGLS
jgi:predicted ATPase/DNA-binding NarL/FixJ family response regulator